MTQASAVISIVLICGCASSQVPAPRTDESDHWQEKHPEWIFCDDFESKGPLVDQDRYFEYNANNGGFVPEEGVGVNGSRGMRARWQRGEVEAGNLKLAFGKVPDQYLNKGIREGKIFRDIYYRMYLKMQPGWEGNPYKLSRATVLCSANWSQAMIAHLWQNAGDGLGIDPASGTDDSGKVVTQRYNDFSRLKWLGAKHGTAPIFKKENAGRWHCIEAHVRLNDPGKSNGIQEFWCDGVLQARSDNLNFTKGFTDYGINAIFFENHWNDGALKTEERYFDNIVVSTKRIGF